MFRDVTSKVTLLQNKMVHRAARMDVWSFIFVIFYFVFLLQVTAQTAGTVTTTATTSSNQSKGSGTTPSKGQNAGTNSATPMTTGTPLPSTSSTQALSNTSGNTQSTDPKSVAMATNSGDVSTNAPATSYPSTAASATSTSLTGSASTVSTAVGTPRTPATGASAAGSATPAGTSVTGASTASSATSATEASSGDATPAAAAAQSVTGVTGGQPTTTSAPTSAPAAPAAIPPAPAAVAAEAEIKTTKTSKIVNEEQVKDDPMTKTNSVAKGKHDVASTGIVDAGEGLTVDGDTAAKSNAATKTEVIVEGDQAVAKDVLVAKESEKIPFGNDARQPPNMIGAITNQKIPFGNDAIQPPNMGEIKDVDNKPEATGSQIKSTAIKNRDNVPDLDTLIRNSDTLGLEEVAGAADDVTDKVGSSAACPAMACQLWCKHGHVVDSNGCEKCECKFSDACPPVVRASKLLCMMQFRVTSASCETDSDCALFGRICCPGLCGNTCRRITPNSKTLSLN